MSDPWSVLVVVPAHDEEETIAECVTSIRVALQQAPIAESMIVVVADRCTDDTVARAQRALGRDDLVVHVDVLNPGAARRAGARIGLQTQQSSAGVDLDRQHRR